MKPMEMVLMASAVVFSGVAALMAFCVTGNYVMAFYKLMGWWNR